MQLSQLHLEFALCRCRPLGEYVEDELCAIDHARLHHRLEVPLLRRAELVVEDHEACVDGTRHQRYLLSLAGAHIVGGVRLLFALDNLPHHGAAGGLDQPGQFREGLFDVPACG
ncbi:MAG: hypothetical protein BWY85_02125 [Firmicutes bacterium ADurb.Bin506]|nr:MAG: hypothetical protein BWY85_02125 [Firmicutes bacterium ADurb.Bin506]